MLLDSLLAKIFYKVFLYIVTIAYTIGGGVGTPSTEAPIDYTETDAILVFAAIADPQVSNYMPNRYRYFQTASKDLTSAKGLDAMLIAGDMAENGLALEYQLFLDNLGNMDLRYIGCVGNHDIRLRLYNQSKTRFCSFMNALNNDNTYDSFHHSEYINGYKFIVMGNDKTEFEENYLSDEQLKWLDSELAAENGKPTFVLVHQPLKNTHGLPEVWGSPFNDAGSIGDQSNEVRAILNKYDNVILVTGHEHTGFGEYTYEKIDNFYSVNIPSYSVNNKNGEYNEHGLGFIVEAYDNEIIFKARDFCKGEWLPKYDISIPVSVDN